MLKNEKNLDFMYDNYVHRLEFVAQQMTRAIYGNGDATEAAESVKAFVTDHEKNYSNLSAEEQGYLPSVQDLPKLLVAEANIQWKSDTEPSRFSANKINNFTEKQKEELEGAISRGFAGGKIILPSFEVSSKKKLDKLFSPDVKQALMENIATEKNKNLSLEK